MNLKDALKLVEINQHLIGQKDGGEVIKDIVAIPNDDKISPQAINDAIYGKSLVKYHEVYADFIVVAVFQHPVFYKHLGSISDHLDL